MTTTRIKKRWILLCLVLLLFSGQIPGCVMVNTPKFGRIVDATTGKGMPDVEVIAVGHFRAQGPIHGSVAEYPYRIVTHTDADGNYWIPNMLLHLRFGLPGTDAMQTWMITAFKPGYAIVGNEKSWSEFDEYGAAKYLPKSTSENPSAWWLGFVIRVNPIKMRPTPLTLKEAVMYYKNVTELGWSIYRAREPEELALTELSYRYFSPLICGMDSAFEMDTTTTGAIGNFAINRDAFLKKLRDLVPTGFQTGYQLPVFKDDRLHPEIFHAKDVCKALTDGD